MRKYFVAGSLVLVVGLGAFFAIGGGAGRGPTNSRIQRPPRYGGRGLPSSSAAPTGPTFVLSKDYEYPYTGSDRVPLCTDDSRCIMVCYTGAVTGSASAWECKKNNGLAASGVSDPGGATIVSSFIPGVKAREITGATAPSIVSPLLDTLFGGAHTVVFGGMPRSAGAPSGFNYWFESTDAAGLYQIRQGSGNTTCTDWASVITMGSVSLQDGWSFGACRWTGSTSGSNNYNGFANDNLFPVTSATAHGTWTGGGAYYFGTRAARDLHLNGPLLFVAFYNADLAAAETKTLSQKYWGVYNSAGVTSGANSQLQTVDNTAASGNIDVFFPGARLSSAAGLIASVAHTNTWATDATNLALDTDIGTPTVNANVSSGPLAVYKKAAECDELVATNAAALDGKQGATAGTAVGAYNVSVFAKQGLTGTVRTKLQLQCVVAGGTGSTTCNFSGLTSTAQRFECKCIAGGSPTSVKPQIRVGNAAGDTGSIQVCHRQHTATINMEPPEIDNSAHGSTFYTLDPVADAWPSPSLGGRLEIVHTPYFDPLASWVSASQGTYYLIDAAVVGVDHDYGLVFGYTVAGRLLSIMRDGIGGSSDIVTNGIGLTAGAAYSTSDSWVPLGGGKCGIYVRHDACGGTAPAVCNAATLINSDVGGTAGCPGAPTSVTLANRYDATVPISSTINAIRYYTQ